MKKERATKQPNKKQPNKKASVLAVKTNLEITNVNGLVSRLTHSHEITVM